jgi:hypothetical protein
MTDVKHQDKCNLKVLTSHYRAIAKLRSQSASNSLTIEHLRFLFGWRSSTPNSTFAHHIYLLRSLHPDGVPYLQRKKRQVALRHKGPNSTHSTHDFRNRESHCKYSIRHVRYREHTDLVRAHRPERLAIPHHQINQHIGEYQWSIRGLLIPIASRSADGTESFSPRAGSCCPSPRSLLRGQVAQD